MKVERTTPVRASRAIGNAAYARRVEAASTLDNVTPLGTSASVLGIPESEFTPRVRDAIMTLMGEVDSLRRELQSAQKRMEEIEKTADQDQLLPMLNRRAFVRELTRHISATNRYGTPASLVYFDLNHFSEINDTYGHPCGDAVLIHFTEVLLANVRDTDVVGRLGGDEFGILLTHATQEQAHAKADQLAQKLNTSPPQWQGKTIDVSFAYGAFELQAGDDADRAMARADEAMYAHKRASR
jgi:diguanylate cyclase (GGDEF)-like protein